VGRGSGGMKGKANQKRKFQFLKFPNLYEAVGVCIEV
jgi:hypothetical protein